MIEEKGEPKMWPTAEDCKADAAKRFKEAESARTLKQMLMSAEVKKNSEGASLFDNSVYLDYVREKLAVPEPTPMPQDVPYETGGVAPPAYPQVEQCYTKLRLEVEVLLDAYLAGAVVEGKFIRQANQLRLTYTALTSLETLLVESKG